MKYDRQVRPGMLATIAKEALQNIFFASQVLRSGNAGEALQDFDRALLIESDGKTELTLGEFKLLKQIAQDSKDQASFATAVGQRIQEMGDDVEPFTPLK